MLAFIISCSIEETCSYFYWKPPMVIHNNPFSISFQFNVFTDGLVATPNNQWYYFFEQFNMNYTFSMENLFCLFLFPLFSVKPVNPQRMQKLKQWRYPNLLWEHLKKGITLYSALVRSNARNGTIFRVYLPCHQKIPWIAYEDRYMDNKRPFHHIMQTIFLSFLPFFFVLC